MKRILVLLLALLVASSAIFADGTESVIIPTDTNQLQALLDGNYPHSARSLAMGGAGVAVGGGSDSFYMNPALLARRTLISIPYLQLSLYHPYDLVKPSEEGTSIVEDMINAIQSENMQDIVGPATDFLSTIKSGKGKLAELEAGVTLGGGGFALGLHVKDTIHTFGDGAGGLDASRFDELNVNMLAALGIRIELGADTSLDLGVSSGLSVLGYTGLVGVQSALDLIEQGDGSQDPMAILESVPIALGYYVPLNVGANVNLPYGFSIGVVGRNLLNSSLGIKMHKYSIDDFTNGDPMEAVSGIFDTEDFTIKTDPTMDLGLGWKWENGLFQPTLAADFVDVIGFFQEGDYSTRGWMDHLRLGAEVKLLSFLDVRGGMNQGYWTVGAGIDLYVLKLDLAYYWQEFGSTAGDYGLDAFTVRFNIGFDR